MTGGEKERREGLKKGGKKKKEKQDICPLNVELPLSWSILWKKGNSRKSKMCTPTEKTKTEIQFEGKYNINF